MPTINGASIIASDSRELQRLREWYRIDRLLVDGEAPTATPERLGFFAASTGRTITDFGAHSERWIERFRKGRELFNP